MQLDLVGAVLDRVQELVGLYAVLVVVAVAAFKVGFLLQDIDGDGLADLLEIILCLLLDLIGGVLCHVDIERVLVGDCRQNDVD